MRLATIRETCKELGVAESILRKAVATKKVPVMMLGNRVLVNVDSAREVVVRPTGCTIEEVSQQTGLTVSAIRRAIREGWMPCEKPGRAYIFHMPDVLEAIQQRMSK